MAQYSLDGLVHEVTRLKKDITLQTVNGDYLKIQYFAHDVDWHNEERDEFFIVLDGTAEFGVENKAYHLKKGNLLVIEAGKKHRASSAGSVLLSIEPHEKAR